MAAIAVPSPIAVPLLGGAPRSPLLNGLVSYWKLDEASGDALDAYGSNHLTAVNAPPTANGRVGTSRDCNGNRYFTTPDNPSLSMGATPLTIACWFYADTLPTGSEYGGLVTKYASGGGREYELYLYGIDNGRPVMIASPDGAVGTQTYAEGPLIPTTGMWHLLIGWVIPNDSINIQYDNGPVVSTPYPYATVYDGTEQFAIGSWPAVTSPLKGRIDEVGLWKRALSASDRALLWNYGQGTTYPFHALPTTPSGLLTNLVSYWRMDEASGNAIDAHGTNHLTDVNTVTSAAGKQGTARQFTAANSEYLNTLDNPELSTGDIDFTIAVWVYADSYPTSHPCILSKWATSSNNKEYLIRIDTIAGNKVQVILSSDGAALDVYTGTVTVNTGGWHFVIVWHDATANTVNVQVDNATPDSFARSTGVFNSAAPFELGVLEGASYWNGRIDEIGMWKRVLTATERTNLFNAGAGISYPFVGVP